MTDIRKEGGNTEAGGRGDKKGMPFTLGPNAVFNKRYKVKTEKEAGKGFVANHNPFKPQIRETVVSSTAASGHRGQTHESDSQDDGAQKTGRFVEWDPVNVVWQATTAGERVRGSGVCKN